MMLVQHVIDRTFGVVALIALGAFLASPSASLAQAKPDLVVELLDNPPAEGFPGDSFVVTVKVTNQGQATASPSTTKFTLVSTTGQPSKNLRGSQNIGVPSGLPSSTSEQSEVTLAIFSDTPAGEYQLKACADEGEVVQESDEENNC